MTSNPTQAQVMQALGHVIEPELHKDLVTLNMIRNLEIKNGEVDFTVMLTTPACPLGEMMSEEIRLVLRDRFPDLADVRVEIVWDPPWSPELMSEESRRQLGMP